MKYVFLLLLCFPAILTAQIVDDFSDGDFSNEPEWIGDTDKFIVNEAFELQLDDPVASDTGVLVTQNTEINDIEWRFNFRLDFSPSGSNLLRVYLISDSEDLKAPLNGYYLEVGETGSLDALNLYRQTGEEEEMILEALPNAGDDPDFGVKVVRSATGLWTYFQELDGGLVEIGSVQDDIHTSSNWFGFYCKHTSTNSDAFFFDDVYIGEEIVDSEGPVLESVELISSNSILLTFDEAVSTVEAINPEIYSIDGVNPTEVSIGGSSNQVLLTFENDFPEDVDISIEVDGVVDVSGNASNLQSLSFSFTNITAGELLITEIFFDPASDSGFPAEYIEVYNPGNAAVDLTGFAFQDESSSPKTISSGSIPAQGYIILCDEEDLDTYSTVGNTGTIDGMPALNNDGDSAILSGESGVIDEVAFEANWLDDADKLEEGGWALERIDLNVPCFGDSNWTASIAPEGGTPGQENSVNGVLDDSAAPNLLSLSLVGTNGLELEFDEPFDLSQATTLDNYPVNQGVGDPIQVLINGTVIALTYASDWQSSTEYSISISGITDCVGNELQVEESFALPEQAGLFDIIITEIMADESPVVGLPEFEYLELYNRSDKFIDLSSLLIFTNPSSQRSFNSYLIKPNEYVILASEDAAEAFSAFGSVVSTDGSVSLTNSGASISITDILGNLIHTVTYSEGLHSNPAKSEGGWSLEMKDTSKPCVQAGNWWSSDDPSGGTPGRVNSVDGLVEDLQGPQLINIEIVQPDSLLLTFDEYLDIDIASNPESYTVDQTVGSPVSLDLNYNLVGLKFSGAWDEDLVYNLNYSLQDCIGNESVQSTIFAVPQEASALDVVITEIMSDESPAVGLPELEYIELYNRSDKFFNLRDWVIYSDPNSPRQIESYLLKPGEYLTVVKPESVDSFTVYGSVASTSANVNLGNELDTLRLFDAQGNWLHQILYKKSMHADAAKEEGGWSLEMIDVHNPCQEIGNWSSSVDLKGGTPGAMNSIAANNADESIPDLLRANYLFGQIVLRFNEIIGPAQVLESSDFTVDNGITVIDASFDDQDRSSIVLTIDQALAENTIYTVTVNQVEDCAGNQVGLKNSARVGVGVPMEAGDVLINEFLPTPKQGEKDYIELYNRSEKIIDLQNVLIAKGDVEQEGFPAINVENVSPEVQLLMFPGDFFVFTVEPQSVLDNFTVLHPENVFRVPNLPAIDDREGVIQILGPPFSFKMDEVHYFSDWHFGLISNKAGVALERTSYEGDSSDGNNWHSAASTVGYGTPTSENSQYIARGEGLSESFSVEPQSFSPDDDGNQDFTRLSYQLTEPGSAMSITIFDDRGREVRRLVQNQLLTTDGFFQWDGTDEDGAKVAIGIYVLLVEIFDLEGNLNQFKETCVVTGRI